MDFKKILKYMIPFLLVGGLLTGCGGDAYIDEGDPNYIEVIEDIAGNANGTAVTAEQLNSLDGVSRAIEGVDYATALAEGTFADPLSPTAEEIQTVVDAANGPDAGTSTLVASPASVVADGTVTSTMTVTVNDANPNPVTDATVTLAQGSGSSTISAVTNNSDGTYTFTVSSTKAETVTYTATADGVTVTQTAEVTFTAGAADAETSTLEANPASVTADGTETSTVTVTVKDAYLNPVTDATVSLAQIGSSTISAVTNVGDGTYTFTASSTTAETVTYTATADGVTVTQTANVTFTAGAADAGESNITAAPTLVVADGTATSAITVTVRDANSNLINNAIVTLSQGVGSSIISGVTNNSDGTYTFTVSSTIAETVTYTATVDGVTVTQTANVTFTAGAADAGTSTLAASPTSVTADGTETSTVTVTVKDAYSNPVADAAVSLAQTGASTISAVTNNSDGTYTFTVRSTTAETVTYTATADGVTVTQTADVTFTPVPLPANITIDNAALQKVIASIFDGTPYAPVIDIQGVIDAGGLTVSVPYTVVTAATTLPAYSRSVTLDASVTSDDESGIVATFAWVEQADLPVGSGFFTATITIDDSAGNADDIYNAKQLDIQDDSAGLVATTFPYATDSTGSTGLLTLKILPGIPDRMFGKADNTGNDRTHEFLYLPVTNTTTGKTWLSNNLGANYANINDPAFSIEQQATVSDDHNAYGSLFQWGRKADGHELITWTDGSTGTGTNGTTSTNSDDPADALFILEPLDPFDWRVNPDDTLWASESSANSVCPIGYRVPTDGELDEERLSWAPNNNAAGALASTLVLPMPGNRINSSGTVDYEGTFGYYWGSTVSDRFAQGLRFSGSNAFMSLNYRASGFTVRCLKEENVPPLPANITIANPLLQKVIPSTLDDTPYTPAIDIQGVIDAGGLTVSVPYTVVTAATTLPAYSRSVTLDASATSDDELGIVATFAWVEQTNLPVGAGFFTATITIDDSAGNADDIYNAKQLDVQDDSAGLIATTFPYALDNAGHTGLLTLKIMPGIPDRMFGKPDNTGNDRTHEFLYVPVINTTTGETWLSNNLGANYANINDPAFSIEQQATASTDHNAYGSLFQWGRKADGHELITWTSGTVGIGTNGTTGTQSDDPTDALFITGSSDWRVNPDDTLWISESSANNVCPVGYRVPTGGTDGELDTERLSWGSNNAAGALASTLVMPLPGYRLNSNGLVYDEGSIGGYWGSTVSTSDAQRLNFSGSSANMYSYIRVDGFTVRCLKD